MAIQKITVHDSAREEFEASYRWYEARQAGLGERFDHAIEERLASIVENPHQGKKSRTGHREILVGSRFPFLIVFVVSKDETELFVSAIYHTKRNPRGKYRRKV